jgi:hypothetical protein
VKIAGLQPYITLGPNLSCNSLKCYVPSRSEYLKGFKDLIKDEPGVKLWGAWNEPDIEAHPLSQHPHRAAEYWQEAQYVVEHTHNCGCKVIAGEFAFADKYEGRYISAYRETIDDYKNKYPPCHTCTHSRPQIWGFHDYTDVVDRNSAFAERFRPARGEQVIPAGILGRKALLEVQDAQRIRRARHPTKLRTIPDGTNRIRTSQIGR